ncbi:uncharacterized protein LOC132915139 [Bombus pascuorum]|uniref:uncharacterized protein LOC132915139 n=1 Tax=Bombus pascuorum TaxID=65598 RepID=UPI00213AA28F|nr:uncharacterized protein LOC132915139 [Bombus pascuorum]
MLRPVHLILLVSMMVLVSCLGKPLKPATMEVESSLNNVKDLNADATAYDSDRHHYGHGWNGGGGGHGGGGGGHGGGGNGHGGGWGGHGGGWEGRGG